MKSSRVVPFDGEVHSADEILEKHLSVRQWQLDNQNNVFSNFYESKKDLGALEDWYIKDGGNFFVAEDPTTGQVIGFVGVRNEGDGAGRIKRMAVLPEYHRRGIGTELVGAAVSWARQNGFRSVVLTTGIHENAKPIYEGFGFKEVGPVARNQDYMMELVFF